MSPARTSKSTIIKTDFIPVTFGAFQFGDYRVPYMSSVLRFVQVKEWLDLVEDDPKYASQDWSIQELFQRGVNQTRVVEISKKYLNADLNPGPKFFNSLTVVLYPDDRQAPNYIAPDEDADYSQAIANLGPIAVGFERQSPGNKFPDSGSFGSLAWTREQVFAVAIDGQHRLAAIKTLPMANAAESDISVLFLVIDKQLGFEAPESVDRLRFMRSIFIDLNKHAVPVSKARNLLLDDFDPIACFVRSFFGPSLNYTPTDEQSLVGFQVGANGEFRDRLPLELIDWHGETKSKVDQGPYITSVLALNWVVHTILKATKSKIGKLDELDSDAGEEYYNDLTGEFESWPHAWITVLKNRVDEGKEDDIPFAFKEDDLAALTTDFRDRWVRPIILVLAGSEPYRELVERRLEKDTISPEFGQWYQAKAALDNLGRSHVEVRKHHVDALNEIETYLKETQPGRVKAFKNTLDDINAKKKNQVLYLLVGQRALVLSLIDLIQSNSGSSWAEWAGIDIEDLEKPNDLYAQLAIEALNACYSNDSTLFSKSVKVNRKFSELTGAYANHFWAGSLLNRDDPDQVDFAEAAARRGTHWFTLLVMFYWFTKCNPDEIKSAKRLYNIIDDPDTLNTELAFGQDFRNAIIDAVGHAGDSDKYCRTHPMRFLVGPLDSWEREKALALGKERIGFIGKVLGLF